VALLAYSFTSNLYVVLLGAASFANVSQEGLVLPFKRAGGPAPLATARQQLVSACNRVHDQLVYGNPQINQASVELELVSGTLEYDIPDDLMRAEVIDIQVKDENGVFQKFPIDFCSPRDMSLLWGPYQNTAGVSYFPRNYTFIPDMTKIRFTGFTYSGTYLVTYRAAANLWTTADLDDAASVIYADVPDTFIDVLQMQIALEVLKRYGDMARMAVVRGELYQAQATTKKSRFDELVYGLAKVGQRRRFWTANLPRTNATPLIMGGANAVGAGFGGGVGIGNG